MPGRPAGRNIVNMTSDFPAGNMRVSDAERDLALGELSDHFQSGRITHEEFDERSTLALRAKTGDDLRELFSDLPGHETSPEPAREPGARPAPMAPPPVRAGGRQRTAIVVIACVSAFLVISQVIGAVADASGSHHVSVNVSWLVPVVIVLIVLRRASRR
jgi:hypothetical protein